MRLNPSSKRLRRATIPESRIEPMMLFSLTKNSVAILCVAVLAIVFFVGGLFDVLDLFIVKVLLFLGYGALVTVAISYALKNNSKKNRPEDQLRDDSH